VFSVRSAPRYKRDKSGDAISQSVKRRLVCDGYQSGSSTVGAMSLLWDIRQPVRTLAEDIVKIRYQETTSEDIEDCICAAVTMIF
jgi:hypothetical protein